MSWFLVITVTWLLIAVLGALLIGRAIRGAMADLVDELDLDEANFVAEPPEADEGSVAPRAANDPPTIPGIPSARPPVGEPPAPPSSGTAPRSFRLG
jgi:hypothetical protein